MGVARQTDKSPPNASLDNYASKFGATNCYRTNKRMHLLIRPGVGYIMARLFMWFGVRADVGALAPGNKWKGETEHCNTLNSVR